MIYKPFSICKIALIWENENKAAGRMFLGSYNKSTEKISVSNHFLLIFNIMAFHFNWLVSNESTASYHFWLDLKDSLSGLPSIIIMFTKTVLNEKLDDSVNFGSST